MHKDYKQIVSEALNLAEQVGNNDAVRSGTTKAIVALTMVVGNLDESAKIMNKNVEELNKKIERYSVSSDNYASAMKWLTVGLLIVGIAQVFTSIFSIFYS